MSNLKKLVIAVIAIIGAILIIISQRGLYSQPVSQIPQTTPTPQTTLDENPKVVSTNPDPLDGITLLPNQTIEITFNKPLENVGEFKYQLDPAVNINVKLTNDRKTATITPVTTYKLGAGFTIFIKTDSKFDGGKRLDHELIYHLNTIGYKGV